MNFPHRYDRNTIIAPETQLELSKRKVAVIGLGGLGGFTAEELARFGIGHIIGFDYDVFSETNLNRQLFSTEANLSLLKAEEAAKRISQINSDVEFQCVSGKLDEAGLKDAMRGCDAAADCLDSSGDRLVLERICEELRIPMVHGAIGGWYGQVSTVFPGDRTIEKIYSGSDEPEGIGGNVVFTAAAVASIQVAELVKLLTGEGATLRNMLLTLDFLNNEFQSINL